MSEYSGRERAYRPRGAARAAKDEPQGDSITSALAAQITLCVILAVCLLLMKKFGNEDYMEIKRQYGVMLSDTSQTAQLAEKFTGEGSGLSGLFAWLDKFSSSLRPDSANGAANSKSEPETVAGTEPEVEYEPGYVPEETEPALQMNFDYLKETTASYYTAQSGGMLPVNEKDTGELLPPPKGSTLSPIYLSANMKPPITGIITSGFSYRYHPITGGSDFHTGLDIAATEGTPILAALPGEVVEAGYSQIYGNYIVLQHADNLKTSYSHCSEIIADEGMTVRQGERIALVGETGTATGPHLHFSVIVEDEFADPSWVLSDYIQLVEE